MLCREQSHGMQSAPPIQSQFRRQNRGIQSKIPIQNKIEEFYSPILKEGKGVLAYHSDAPCRKSFALLLAMVLWKQMNSLNLLFFGIFLNKYCQFTQRFLPLFIVLLHFLFLLLLLLPLHTKNLISYTMGEQQLLKTLN